MSDFALLGLTEAKLPSDGFSVVDPLDPAAHQCDLMLDVAGYRYYADKVQLAVGDPVLIQAEPANRYDPGAVMVSAAGEKIGNINRLQAKTFRHWLNIRRVSAVIERLNGRVGKPRAYIFTRVRPAA